MTNPLDPAVEAQVEEVLHEFASYFPWKPDQLKGNTYNTAMDQAETAITRLLLRERVEEVNHWFSDYYGNQSWLNTKPISIKRIEARITTLEARIKELE